MSNVKNGIVNEPNVIKGTQMIIKLKELRADRDFSQHKLAQMCDMTVPNLQKYEYGKMKSIPFTTLEKFCKALNCKPGELIDLKNEEVIKTD